MDQYYVAAFALAFFGGTILGYTYRRREDRRINVTPDIHSVTGDLEERARRSF